MATILPDRIVKQPDSIKGIMREYQVEGVSFMAERFEQGIHPILAGESRLGTDTAIHLQWPPAIQLQTCSYACLHSFMQFRI